MLLAEPSSTSVPNSKLVEKAIWLSWFTIAYNTLEGAISIFFGWSEGSISLMGFGADSYIEVASAILVLWRFKGEIGRSASLALERERKATLGIGILFLLLGLLTSLGSILQLVQRSHPETTVPGLVVSILSLSFMFGLWKAKRSVGQSHSSPTVLKDASCSLACIKLSVILLVGSAVFWLAPQIWWADSVSALLLAGFILREGWETITAARSENFAGSGCGCD